MGITNFLLTLVEILLVVLAFAGLLVISPFLILYDLYQERKRKGQPPAAPPIRPGSYMPPHVSIQLSFDDDLEKFKEDLRKHEKHIK